MKFKQFEKDLIKLSEEFDENPITSRYKLIRHDIGKFEIVDQYEQKFTESEFLPSKMGVRESFKMSRDVGKGLEVPWWGLKDSTNTPMGEIAVQVKDRDPFNRPYTIKNSMGETVATFSMLGLTKDKIKNSKMIKM
jgi:hypothetical protein